MVYVPVRSDAELSVAKPGLVHCCAAGRPASIDADQERKMKAEGMGSKEIAKVLKIGSASVYRGRLISGLT